MNMLTIKRLCTWAGCSTAFGTRMVLSKVCLRNVYTKTPGKAAAIQELHHYTPPPTL